MAVVASQVTPTTRVTPVRRTPGSGTDASYYFLFDSFTQEGRFQAEISRIEARVHQLGLIGRSERFSILKDIREMVESAVKRGASTVVIAGNDQTIARVIPVLGSLEVTLGFIPLGSPNRIASILGVPEGAAACDVLSRRITKRLDLGRANDQFFLFSCDIPESPVAIQCDGQYSVSAIEPGCSFSICNLGNLAEFDRTGRTNCDPADGKLELVVTAKGSGSFGMFRRGETTESVLPIREAKVTCASDSVPLLLDGQTVVKTPATLTVARGTLRLIVGKERKF